jgi:3-deoxy-D-manno-octulosonic-acid transferase
MLIVYKILVNLLYFVLWPYSIYKRKKTRAEWNQRCAISPEEYLLALPAPDSDQPKGGFCHFHASSMGEVRVLERLVSAVKSIRPDLRYCVSTYTRTGQELARDIFPDAESVFYFPLDSYFPLRRFFSRFRPVGIVMVETEIWPYFLDFCRRRNISLVLGNGRLSTKSTKRYKKFRGPLSSLLKVYRRLIMQTDIDRERMIAIGADSDRVMVLGNIKHDRKANIDISGKRTDVRHRFDLLKTQPLLVGASTRPGEEEVICHALQEISAFPAGMKLLLAPRHLERLDEVAKILNEAGFAYTLYSEIEAGRTPSVPVILMDKMGLLADIFYGADLAFVGGTLVDLGGHNIMEPVLAGVPVLFGPSVFNIADAADSIIRENQGMMVHDAAELSDAIRKFVDGHLSFQSVGRSGPSVAEQTAEIIARELGL